MSLRSHAGPAPARVRHRPSASSLTWWITLVVSAVLLLGAILPIAYAALRSVPLYESGGSFTLDNYTAFLSDASFWTALWNTSLLAVLTAVPSILIGTALAVLVTRTNMPGRSLIGVLLLAPLLFPGLGATLGWVSMYAPSGYISTWFANTFGGVPWNLYSIPGMALVSLERTVPMVYLLARARLSTLDSSIEDAALSAGAGPARILRTITLPMMRPSLLLAGVLISMMVFESLGLPLLLGTSSGIETVSTYIYNNWTRSADNQGLVSATASTLLLIVTLMMLLRSRLEGDSKRFVTASGKPKARRPLDLGIIGPVASVLCLAWVVLAIVMPTFGLLMTAFTQIFSPLISPWEVLTTHNFSTVFDSPAFTRSIRNSILVAVVGALVSTVALTIAALVAHRSEFRFRTALPPLLLFPRAMPGIVVGMGLFWAFVVVDPSGWVRASIWGIMIAFVIRNTAVGYAAIESTLLSISNELDGAARTCGAGWLRTGWTIVVPLLRPALGACFVLMFVALLNDYDPAIFLMTSGNEVIGLTMLRQWLAGFAGPVAALGVIQMLITAVVLGSGRLFFGVKAHV
ncbi:ABC transporter permease [Nocardioides humi]|uniref:Iron ABC transporter permease n=1 Tax=Nocardioides humi TaxID=449461 RepID=A0ABN1ZPA6_9ACTN|nr:iron ABC transporter permease [Nocardioides humi]